MTDAPNFGTEFGRRRPCPRYGVPRLSTPLVAPVGADDLGGPTDRPGVSMKIDGFPPPFSFWGAKKKMAVEPSKEKTLIAAQLRARDAPCRAAGRGPKPFCSINAVPARVRAGLLAGYRTRYAVLNKEVIGQRPNLTSCSFRAFRFAKRCLGGRGGGPPFGMAFAPIPAHPSPTRARTLRCAPAGLGG